MVAVAVEHVMHQMVVDQVVVQVVFYLTHPLRFHLVKIILLVLVLVVIEQQAMAHMELMVRIVFLIR